MHLAIRPFPHRPLQFPKAPARAFALWLAVAMIAPVGGAFAQSRSMPDAQPRVAAPVPDQPGTVAAAADGVGPYKRLIIRGVNLIDGTGSPMLGPVDLVIEGNRIRQIAVVGYPGVPVNEARRPQAGPEDAVLQADGLYALPGFFDNHAHTGGLAQGTTPDYVYKLWLAHGITTIREPGSGNGMD